MLWVVRVGFRVFCAFAPRATANCMAKTATPPPAPVTSTVLPLLASPLVTKALHAVRPATGMHAASMGLRCEGRGLSWDTGTLKYSLKVPGNGRIPSTPYVFVSGTFGFRPQLNRIVS